MMPFVVMTLFLSLIHISGVGSMLSGLLNTGYNIYSGNRQYEADRADTQWNQQLQERQMCIRDRSLTSW